MFGNLLFSDGHAAGPNDARTQKVISRGLDWLANTQSSRGSWTANEGRYPTSMTALAARRAGRRLDHHAGQISEEHQAAPSTTWSSISRSNGLIGDPTRDDRYTYGHGFSMLFLSQVLGEEEDEDARKDLVTC